MEHELVIDSLHDAQAHCSAGDWSYSFTGARTRAEIAGEFALHLHKEITNHSGSGDEPAASRQPDYLEVSGKKNHMTQASAARIKCFVDWFIRSDYVQSWTAEKDSDFINEPDRAARCNDAAEFGADGKTHAEVIEDWRESFKAWLRDRRYTGKRLFGRYDFEYPCFESAVNAHFDSVEQWHENNGSLFDQIG